MSVAHPIHYMKAASGIFDDENIRWARLIRYFAISLMSTYQNQPHGVVESSTKAGRLCFLFLVKGDGNEFGDGTGSDPSTQAGLSAVRSWVQHEVVYVFSFNLPVHFWKVISFEMFRNVARSVVCDPYNCRKMISEQTYDLILWDWTHSVSLRGQEKRYRDIQ